MGEIRMQFLRMFGLMAFMLLATSSFAAGNGNFEQTVGSALADMSRVRVELAAAARAPDKRLVACELCEPTMPLAVREENRLDQRLRSQYRQIGESLAAKLWDDPKGRRIKFDIEGRPGLGLEIPFD